jgi:hypothetical protein
VSGVSPKADGIAPTLQKVIPPRNDQYSKAILQRNSARTVFLIVVAGYTIWHISAV